MVEDKYIKDFENWCKREHIRLVKNDEIFFINKRKTLIPMFKTGSKVYVHIVDAIPVTDYPMYNSFADSFYTIIVIPKGVIVELVKSVTRQDIANHFEINL
jgi:hypothetical protein